MRTQQLEGKAAHLPVRYMGGGRFLVASGSEPGLAYSVQMPARQADPSSWSCSCPWAQYGGGSCSHVRAARLEAERIMEKMGKRTAWQAQAELAEVA